MKRAENVDGSTKMKLPSMKMAVFVDGKLKTQLPSMKRAVFVDGNVELHGKGHHKKVCVQVNFEYLLRTLCKFSGNLYKCNTNFLVLFQDHK